uniref:AlNc14C23G2364 protein n=1 Tax=Albugo laibachii Nc14 TaxID=890382 RepID=F0W665_9STRA|nr:AlNc14C23G2364 [Albugo laibachii Nc14]|eukprot:CCA16607.1 AlNc14C23G2364 [Albugo laibachii Nc14]
MLYKTCALIWNNSFESTDTCNVSCPLSSFLPTSCSSVANPQSIKLYNQESVLRSYISVSKLCFCELLCQVFSVLRAIENTRQLFTLRRYISARAGRTCLVPALPSVDIGV